MRRLAMLSVLALSAFMLSACASMTIIYKDAPAVLVPGDTVDEPVVMTVPETASSASPLTGTNAPVGATSQILPEASPSILPEETTQASPTGTPDTPQQAAPTDTGMTEAAGTSPETSQLPDNGDMQPPLLTEMVRKAGLSFDDMTSLQLVLVAADGSKVGIYCYDKGENGRWKLNGDIGYIKGYVGRNGVRSDKREGDGCTPTGLFGLGYAFGNNAKPETGMMWRAVGKDTYWIDDPDSIYYNQWIEGTANADWDSAEHLSAYAKNYAYAIVVEYNTENTVAGKGSAVFLHCKNEPTSGCIAAPQDDILKMLKWLSEEKNPGILIVGR